MTTTAAPRSDAYEDNIPTNARLTRYVAPPSAAATTSVTQTTVTTARTIAPLLDISSIRTSPRHRTTTLVLAQSDAHGRRSVVAATVVELVETAGPGKVWWP